LVYWADCRFAYRGDRPIREQLTDEEQVRFHNLLKLAKESPFEGERRNALAAAERLAARRGLTLEEAAMRQAQPQSATSRQAEEEQERARDFAAFVHMTDYQIYLDKQRRDAARKEAEARGLDQAEKREAERRAAASASRFTRRSKARMPPEKHAWALVRETQLSYQEIARITGLDICDVLLMKIQLLRAA
jgi:hypothetical protein